jgi:type III pantothenate kinase
MSKRAARTPKLLLALDLGNTNLGCALFDGPTLVHRATIPAVELTDNPELWDARLPRELLSRVGVSLLSSVNPRVAALVGTSLGRRLGKPPLKLGADVAIPVRVRVDRPEEVGADRLLNVLAGFHRTHAACLIVDLGTALTIDVCDPDGAYVGGIIAPGIRMSASALHDHTALLPQVKIDRAGAITGRNTLDCIRSGLFWGTVASIEGLVARLRLEQPATKTVLATGGDASLIAPSCPVIDEVVPDLHFEGLRLIADSAGLTS